jgi:hypothetical protein
MISRRQAALACAGGLASFGIRRSAVAGPRVRVTRVPQGGLQPQTVLDQRGILHLVYYTGDARKGNLFYVHSADYGATFSRPIPVNRSPETAIAAGTIRGAQLAVGKAGRVHVAWNGSALAEPGPLNPDSGKPGMPMLYARLNDAAQAFEPQRSLMLHSFGLDGGGSIAADPAGNVYVSWHGIGMSEAKGTGKEGEARRRVWITKSSDDGRSFARERQAWPEETGACSCCGMKMFAAQRGDVFALYRSATASVHRDIYFLSSTDGGRSFQGRLLHKWDINACPMSSMDIAESAGVVFGAWETGGQVFWARLAGGPGSQTQPVAAPGEGKGRKHPRLAVNRNGEMLLVWTEGTGWEKGGSLAYQLYNPAGQPTPEKGQLAGVATWSFAAPIALADNSFSILY